MSPLNPPHVTSQPPHPVPSLLIAPNCRLARATPSGSLLRISLLLSLSPSHPLSHVLLLLLFLLLLLLLLLLWCYSLALLQPPLCSCMPTGGSQRRPSVLHSSTHWCVSRMGAFVNHQLACMSTVLLRLHPPGNQPYKPAPLAIPPGNRPHKPTSARPYSPTQPCLAVPLFLASLAPSSLTATHKAFLLLGCPFYDCCALPVAAAAASIFLHGSSYTNTTKLVPHHTLNTPAQHDPALNHSGLLPHGLMAGAAAAESPAPNPLHQHHQLCQHHQTSNPQSTSTAPPPLHSPPPFSSAAHPPPSLPQPPTSTQHPPPFQLCSSAALLPCLTPSDPPAAAATKPRRLTHPVRACR